MSDYLSYVLHHPLTWLLGIIVGLFAWLDAQVVPHFVLWGSAGLVALGYWQKWRNRNNKGEG